jgi:hypothetical protein
MNKLSSRIILVLLSALLLGNSSVTLAQWTNYYPVQAINFDGETYGADPLTTYPVGVPTIPNPATNLYGWSTSNTDFANSNGTTHTIGDAAGLTKAVILSNNTLNGDFGGGIASVWLDTQFTPPRAERGIFDFDFAVLSTPTDPTQMIGPNTPNGQDFVINAFLDQGLPAFRFVTTHSSVTGGDIQLRNPGQPFDDLFTIGTYTNGVATHVQINLDYVHGTINTYLNGVLAVSGLPFVFTQTSTNDQLTEFFIYNNGVAGQLTAVAIDNIYYVVVPEPSATLLTFMGVLIGGLMLRRLRK